MTRKAIEYVIPAPLDFEFERQRVHEYLSRDLDYKWMSTRTRALVPRDACCIVLCGKTRKQPATAICLAFAHKSNGQVHWFGVTAAWHDPVELYGVTGFVPVADARLYFSHCPPKETDYEE
jgi:hypothetical protein